DMGEAVRIVDLARNLIKLSGFKEEDIGIAFTGTRQGEKLFEELLLTDEIVRPTKHPQIFAVRAAHPPEPAWWEDAMAQVSAYITAGAPERLRTALDEILSKDLASSNHTTASSDTLMATEPGKATRSELGKTTVSDTA
ncbi:MAG: polysaccharide biosynthesis protein, partial [Cyanobacteria bacterium NC_groundwater_1444_Ag_S-0.65um_54_12]|nr:polysaccharide biosynthesis protein [Cyanobacteria bacterium NC_groundwater_1444_Ag_S-0.65um_54_12]